MLRCAVTAFGILVACGAAGCASLQQTDHTAACTAQNWERFGENDGRLGINTQDRIELFEDCNLLGQPADIAAYEAGKARGLSVYCTLENGLNVGQSGRPYAGVCNGQEELDFLQGYDVGASRYSADRPVSYVYPSLSIGLGFGYGSYGYYGFYPAYRSYRHGHGHKKKHHDHKKHGGHKSHGGKHSGHKHAGHKQRTKKTYFRPSDRPSGRRKNQFSER